MICRQAMFFGLVKPGKEAAMRAFVEAELAPLWRQFTDAQPVHILYTERTDAKSPAIPLILSITYDDQAAIDAAMATPARYKSRDMLPAFYEEFFVYVNLHHYQFEVT